MEQRDDSAVCSEPGGVLDPASDLLEHPVCEHFGADMPCDHPEMDEWFQSVAAADAKGQMAPPLDADVVEDSICKTTCGHLGADVVEDSECKTTCGHLGVVDRVATAANGCVWGVSGPPGVDLVDTPGAAAAAEGQVGVGLQTDETLPGTAMEACEVVDLASTTADAAMDGMFEELCILRPERFGVYEEACEVVEEPSMTPDAASEAQPGSRSSDDMAQGTTDKRFVRITGKRRSCTICGGPCEATKCSGNTSVSCNGPLAPPAQPKNDTLKSGCDAPSAPDLVDKDGEAADVFMAVARKMREDREAAAAAAAAVAGAAATAAANSASQASSSGQDTGSAAARRKSAAEQPEADDRRKRRRQVQVPLNFGALPDWLRRDPKVGGVRLHPSHAPHLGFHKGITWCWSCGTFALEVPSKLRSVCKPPTVAGARQLARLKDGLTPRNSVSWLVETWQHQDDRDREGTHQ